MIKRLFFTLTAFIIFPFIAQSSPQVYTEIGGISVSEESWAQDKISYYINVFTQNFGKTQLYNSLDKSEYLRLYIRQELKKRNMPTALEYLPFVESEYTSTAISKSGAKGLWQFMDNSMAPFLKKTDWYDERYDPWKSTDAALTKLQDNYKMFNDWPLAIAAYNCGAGAMKTILKKTKNKSFWYIAQNNLLRDQSVQYVPKLLAVCELAQNSEKYGITIPEPSTNPYFADFDYIETSYSISLTRLAAELRVNPDTLRNLNTALLHDCTPPDCKYQLRLPPGLKSSAQIALNCILQNEKNVTYFSYSVKRGDTLYSLSKRYKVSIEELYSINNIEDSSTISVGKILYIPQKKRR